MARARALPRGKLDPRRLPSLVFGHLEWGPEVVVGPGVGEDAAAIRLAGTHLVAASDPITGASDRAGWLAVHVNANDVATMGARPRWFLPVVLLAEGSGEPALSEVMAQMARAAREVGASIVGGHTEVTPGLGRTLVSGCMLGTARRLVAKSGVRPGDDLILTKGAAIEGAFILATDRRLEVEEALGRRLAAEARGQAALVSVVPEALAAARAGCSAMHDATEGGVLGAVHELCAAGRVGFRVERARIRVTEASRGVCEVFGLDPLRTISSGSLLAAAPRARSAAVLAAVRARGVWADVIGRAVPAGEGATLVDERGRARPCPFPAQDELWRVVGR